MHYSAMLVVESSFDVYSDLNPLSSFHTLLATWNQDCSCKTYHDTACRVVSKYKLETRYGLASRELTAHLPSPLHVSSAHQALVLYFQSLFSHNHFCSTAVLYGRQDVPDVNGCCAPYGPLSMWGRARIRWSGRSPVSGSRRQRAASAHQQTSVQVSLEENQSPRFSKWVAARQGTNNCRERRR